ncbi:MULTISPECIES: cyanophycinase [unclassified Schlesneria]|uniref:cyanophycinase n=2 Tax=Planctomycetaceae TaxID=126 RepID=UPI00359FB04C
MRWTFLLGLLLAAPGVMTANDKEPLGTLVVIGGGFTTAEIREKTLELAGGEEARVAIIADANPENGPDSVELWQETNAQQVDLIDSRKPALARRILNNADLIWIPGGLQGVFMNSLQGTGLKEVVQRRYREGAVVAGTSAGAAVMSKVMIGGRSDLDSLKVGTAPYLMNGLGLWPDVIIDQHFLQKGRFNRLALATIDHPDLLGIGIDEETAAIVRGREFEVIGSNNVTVIDGRRASREELTQGAAAAVRNLSVHVLRAGMKFNLDDKK